jgi:signal transduction histidine kinase
MFGSLRFRVPALFVAGIALAAIVSAAIAVRLFQNYTHSQSLKELKREALGLTHLYEQQAIKASDEGRSAPEFASSALEGATGDRLFYVGVPIFPGQSSGLKQLPRTIVNWSALQAGRTVTFEFVPPAEHRTFLAVANPLQFKEKGPTFGALIVATPKNTLRHAWLTLMKFVAFSLLGGLLVAGALSAYLSRRLTRPVLGLSKAADEVARGNYDVTVPQVPGGGEVGHLTERFREMASRLREAEEMERNFLMSVSHELRTPLTAIKGHAEALREGLAEDPEARAHSLDVIAEAASRLERLVGDVLDLAKLDARRFTLLREEVDMGRLLEQAYDEFGEEARRREIDYRCDANTRPVIVSDGDRVLQVISNLLTNAFRWTPDGGTVELALSSENGTVAVSVSDTGPGISAEERERIFRPFWSRDGGGTGLGLAIARELATALGGRIELDTKPGRGSRFALVLPAMPAD